MHGFEGLDLHRGDVVEHGAPLIRRQAHAVEERVQGGVDKPHGPGHADIPLRAQAHEELHRRPVFGPDFDGFIVKILRQVAGGGELFSAGRGGVDGPGGGNQFPRRPSQQAAR